METITSSAILHNGNVFFGRKRHYEIIRDIIEYTGIKRVPGSSTQGFMTNAYQFLNREEAAHLALKSGQIKKLKFGTTQLFSEDLW
jgi:hypothetical protein